MYDGSAPAWRNTLDRHHAALAEDLSVQVNAEIESRVSLAISETSARVSEQVSSRVSLQVAEETRRKVSESLNQTLRRIRQTAAEHETLQLLLEDSTSCAESAVVLLIENGQASVAAWRGLSLAADDSSEINIQFAVDSAAAVASCVETRDPVVALAETAQISEKLANAGYDNGKVYLFPITARQSTVAMMLAFGAVTPAPLELLCEAVGMRLESFDVAPTPAPRPAPSPFVQIGASETKKDEAGSSNANSGELSWSNLSADEQSLHLRAQRAARVRTAQIRIDEPDALRRGVQTADIYGALKPLLDDVRENYRRQFIAQSPTMVDYLHLEILRSLAHDNGGLLGKDYPGPLA